MVKKKTAPKPRKKGSGMKRKPSKKIILEAIEKFAGCKVDIAEALGFSRQTVAKWIDADQDLKDASTKGNDVLLDLAKKGLRWHLENKSEKSIHYTLDRLGRKDGFGMMLQIADKSKITDQIDEMTNEELLKHNAAISKKIADANAELKQLKIA